MTRKTLLPKPWSALDARASAKESTAFGLSKACGDGRGKGQPGTVGSLVLAPAATETTSKTRVGDPDKHLTLIPFYADRGREGGLSRGCSVTYPLAPLNWFREYRRVRPVGEESARRVDYIPYAIGIPGAHYSG
jgi:hypothetical protein